MAAELEGGMSLYVTTAIIWLGLASLGHAQQMLFVAHDSGWGRMVHQQTPPAAFVMSVGVCNRHDNDNCDFGACAGMLNPLIFYPSTHTQTVTITSATGQAFKTFAQVFAQGGDIGWAVPRVLSNSGLVPLNFFPVNLSDGGNRVFSPATVTSVKVVLAPFAFQQKAPGEWEAVGGDGNPPQMLVQVYGNPEQ
jgi:hypothetical protein